MPKAAKKRPLRLVQFSDCHVSGSADREYRGADPRKNLDDVLAQIAAWPADILVGTGDLSEDLSEASYRYLEARLAKVGLPLFTLPGNHDDAGLQQAYLSPCPVDRPVIHDAGAWRLVLLNSVVENEVSGRLAPGMLDGLATALEGSEKYKLVFLHHQPVPVGSPWIDRFPLRDPEPFWTCLEGRADVRIVAWGHVHQPFSALRGGIRLLGAPSTAVNSLPGREKFTPDSRGPACRWFELEADGGFNTGILGQEWERPDRR